MKMISRRDFAKSLGAAAVLLPFLTPQLARAAGGAKNGRRLLVIYTLGTTYSVWKPKSAPGAPVVFNDAYKPLEAIKGDIVLADGLSFGNPMEGHSTAQTLTARSNGSNPIISVDQYVAQKLGVMQPLLLGVQAAQDSQFFNSTVNKANGSKLPVIDGPQEAFNLLFGGNAPPAAAAPAPGAAATTLPRQNILDLVTSQIKQLQGSLGSHQRSKLDEHLTSITNMQTRVAPSAGCAVPPAPDLNGLNPQSADATLRVGDLHSDLAVSALACGLSRVVGIQWGVSNTENLALSPEKIEVHSAVHSGQQGIPKVIAGESYLSTWFAKLVTKLKMTADPESPGKSLLDTTLVVWTRDFGDAPVHLQYGVPYVLAGAKDYLKTDPAGTYVHFGGDDASATKGQPHERLMLNICEALGVTDYSGYGSLPGPQKLPLPELKA